MAKGKGRRKGSRNRGYFFRGGRGWYTKVDGQFVPLNNETGERLCDERTPLAEVKAAYFRVMSGQDFDEPVERVKVLDICQAYLAKVDDDGAPSTYEARQRTLFEFCFGLPSRFIPREGKPEKWPKHSDSE